MNKAIVIKKYDRQIKDLGHQPTLDEAQQIVEGYIQLLKAKDSKTGELVTLVVNEDGKPQELPVNLLATKLFGPSIYGGYLVGNIIVLKGWKSVK